MKIDTAGIFVIPIWPIILVLLVIKFAKFNAEILYGILSKM